MRQLQGDVAKAAYMGRVKGGERRIGAFNASCAHYPS